MSQGFGSIVIGILLILSAGIGLSSPARGSEGDAAGADREISDPGVGRDADADAGADVLRAPSGSRVILGADPPRRQARPDGQAPGLDSLLQLPDGFAAGRDQPRVAGVSEGEWRRRFEKARAELAEASSELIATRRELDEVVEAGGGSQWAMAPAMGGAAPSETSPLSFRLREMLKRNRDRVEAAEKQLRQLEIEADLAGVPRSWRSDDPSTSKKSEEKPE